MESLHDQAGASALGELSRFRQEFYTSLTLRADALFELTDAVLCADGPVRSLVDLTLFEKQVRGSLFGSSNPRIDIFKMLDLYDAGQLKLDELITRTYELSEVNEGYDDLRNGRNLRGVIRF